MSNINLNKAGGTAFPVDRISVDDGSVSSGLGMTLRDYFAAAAVPGYLSLFSDPGESVPKPDLAAQYAYKVADAMLAARDHQAIDPYILDALIELREEHSRIDPHHEDMCPLCKKADAAIKKARGEA